MSYLPVIIVLWFSLSIISIARCIREEKQITLRDLFIYFVALFVNPLILLGQVCFEIGCWIFSRLETNLDRPFISWKE